MSAPFRYLSVCSGIEAASVAWHPLGWSPAAFSEIEAFPRVVLAHRFPHVPLHGDFTTIKGNEYGPVDLLVGGTPCFPAETLIATRSGLMPISEVEVGDDVLTHAGRYRRVLATGSKKSSTVRLRGQGQSFGVVTTADHPFFSRKKTRVWVGGEHGSWSSRVSSPEWTRASAMQGLMWASPAAWPDAFPPEILLNGRERGALSFTPELAWVIGRWLGDGWCRINDRRGYVLICCAFSEGDDIAKALELAGLNFSRMTERTTTRFQIANRAFARWLTSEFGSGAFTKTMPTWLFGWEHRSALLEGYLSADGHVIPNGRRLTTVSDALALGSVLLAHSLGFSASRSRSVPRRNKATIEGRSVRERPFWQISIYDKARSSIEIGGHRWGVVRSVSLEGERQVFNLEVEEDNSYVADGFVVHNCQDFSVAGLRKGLSGERGNLTLEFLRLAQRIRPRWLVWENVPGVLSQDGGRAFGAILGGILELGYGFAYRVLDAQFVRVDGLERAVPQRRRRVFVVGYLGDWRRAAAVLFEREGLSGHPAPRRIAGQGFAQDVVASLVSSGRGVERAGETRGKDPVVAIPLLEIGKGTASRGEGQNGSGLGNDGDPMFTLQAGAQHGIAFGGNNTAGPINVATALNEHGGPSGRQDFESETFVVAPPLTSNSYGDHESREGLLVAHSLRGEGFDASEDGTGRGTPIVPICFDTTQITSRENRCNPQAGDPCHPMAAGAHAPAIAFSCKDYGADAVDEVSPILRAMGHADSHANAGGQMAVAFGIRSDAFRDGEAKTLSADAKGRMRLRRPGLGIYSECAPTIDAGQPHSVATAWAVRRLTPMEAERLQGFPDGWTDVTYRSKPASDGPRYKALGNSMAVNCMRWIGTRIAAVEALPSPPMGARAGE